MQTLTTIALILVATAAFGQTTRDEERIQGMQETLRTYIEHSPIIADICIYEQQWIPPTATIRKGQLVSRAVVTHVHHGSLKIGTRLEYTNYVEDAPRLFGPMTYSVAGTLRTFFFDPDESKSQPDGLIKIEGDGHWGFGRVDGIFAQVFDLELRSNPKLQSAPKTSH